MIKINNVFLFRYLIFSFIDGFLNSLQKVEPWESEKSEADMEYYDWEMCASKKSIMSFSKWIAEHNIEPLKEEHITEYKEAVSDLMNQGK